MTPEQELNLLLSDNPHLQSYQNKIQSSLLKCSSVEKRLDLLMYLIQDNLVELNIEVSNLADKLDKL